MGKEYIPSEKRKEREWNLMIFMQNSEMPNDILICWKFIKWIQFLVRIIHKKALDVYKKLNIFSHRTEMEQRLFVSFYNIFFVVIFISPAHHNKKTPFVIVRMMHTYTYSRQPHFTFTFSYLCILTKLNQRDRIEGGVCFKNKGP